MLPAECRVLRNGLDADLERYRRDPEAAAQVIAVGRSRPDPALPAEELAAYTIIGNVLLNLDETINRE
jgi:hypothetical protein